MTRFIVRDLGNWYVVDNVTEVRVLCDNLFHAIELAYFKI